MLTNFVWNQATAVKTELIPGSRVPCWAYRAKPLDLQSQKFQDPFRAALC